MSVSPHDTSVVTVVAHAYGDGEHAERLASALRTPEVRSALVTVQERFDAIDGDTPEEELEEIWDHLQAVIAEFPAEFPPLTEVQSRLIQALVERDLNQRQKELLRRQL
jgi:hypothetical protein